MGRYKQAITDYVDAISCDGLLEISSCYSTINELGKEPFHITTIAKNAGWVQIDGKWFCPSCAAKKANG